MCSSDLPLVSVNLELFFCVSTVSVNFLFLLMCNIINRSEVMLIEEIRSINEYTCGGGSSLKMFLGILGFYISPSMCERIGSKTSGSLTNEQPFSNCTTTQTLGPSGGE